MKKLVIFDFDGVLADTIRFCYKIHKDINASLTWEKFQGFSDGNFIEGIRKSVEEESYIIPKNFYEFYEKNLYTINIHENLRAVVLRLKNQYNLSIISSTNGSYISNFLKKEKALGYFGDILGSDAHMSKVVKINTLLEKYKIKPKDAVFITDTTGDIMEARKCGVQSITVAWGLHSKDALLREKPFALVNTPQELEEKIEEFLK